MHITSLTVQRQEQSLMAMSDVSQLRAHSPLTVRCTVSHPAPSGVYRISEIPLDTILKIPVLVGNFPSLDYQSSFTWEWFLSSVFSIAPGFPLWYILSFPSSILATLEESTRDIFPCWETAFSISFLSTEDLPWQRVGVGYVVSRRLKKRFLEI